MFPCMRTTVEINDELLRRAKRCAADAGESLRAVIEAALRSYLGNGADPDGYSLQWRAESGRIQPGVRLDDRDSLFDLMDGRR